jgi:predicted nuclease of restriction endonuclease-like (RecB) superfamily
MHGRYERLLQEIKTRIRSAQLRASLSSNRELILLYWDVGRMLDRRQSAQGWGSGVVPRLAKDLHNDFPEIKGFSERNLNRMIAFFREYPALGSILPQAVALLDSTAKPPAPAILPQAVAKLAKTDSFSTLSQLTVEIPWGQNLLLMEKVKEPSTRLWYVQQTITHGWSRSVLALMIESDAHERQGRAVTNFTRTLPPVQSDLARETLKDPYIFDFLTLEKPFHERELETGLLNHLRDFLVELGVGFAFVGRQVRMEVGDEDFYIDLLFYHLRLRSYVVIELKVGAFKAEYAGKMNFYLNAVDDRLRHSGDQPSIGLILCQKKNRVVAEYALRGMTKAIGVSTYRLTRALPKKLRSDLPSIKDIEAELSPPATKSKS